MLGIGAAGAATVEAIATPVRGIAKDSGYHFGAGNERVVAALRNLAADIESGGSHTMGLTVLSKVSPEDFLTHTLSIEFAMNAPSPER